jgi:MFS transporter, MHS family, proline/betaine transporter
VHSGPLTDEPNSMPIETDIRCQRWRTIVAVSAGNAFEWFDFVIFGYFAVEIAKQFFPNDDQASAIELSLAIFGAAFVMRPLGAIVLGYYADRHGRKPGLTLTISLMTIGTALIVCAPPRETAGSLGPSLVLAGRLAQGFSAGGEFGSATALLAEQDPRHRGFFASWQFASQALTVVLATSFGAALSGMLHAEQLTAWGWRIPFLFGVLIGPIALYIRKRVFESVEFQSAPLNNSPLRAIVGTHKARLLTALGLVTVATVTIYTLVFTPTFAVHYLGYSTYDGFLISLITGVVQIALIPAAGALSDAWARLPLAGAATLAILVTAIPLLARVTSNPTFVNLLIFQVWTGAQLAIYVGALPAMMSELFPARVRTTGLSLAYSLSVAVFGGFAPLTNAFLIDISGSNVAPSYYLAAAAVVSLASLAAARSLGIK